MWPQHLLSHFFIAWRFLTKTFKNMSLWFSINSSKYVQLWNLVLKTILILIKFPLEWYTSCRHLNFAPTYENGSRDDFLPFWKFGHLGASWPFCGLHQNFSGSHRAMEVIGPFRNLKPEFSLDLKFFAGLCYRAWTKSYVLRKCTINYY